jgi:ribosomal protein S18 acetylase RimI-like enzyme
MQIETRPAMDSDAQLVYEVTEAAMRSYVERTFGPWVPSFQQETIGKSFDPTTHQIILVNGEVAGILVAPVHDSHVQLEKLYLFPRFQRQGIGSHLVQQLVQMAVASSKPIRLRVLAVNVGARRLYERLGFAVSSVTPERIFMEYNA